MLQKPFVGVYWTLPVNWAGFRDVPPDVDAAAAASRTIHYQRERIRLHVQENGGRLVAEIAFMDVRTDRATDVVRDVLRRQAGGYAGKDVTLLAVAFDAERGWRHNPFLVEAAGELGLELRLVSPDPLTIEGEHFDPARHFAAWRKQDEIAMATLSQAAHEALQQALEAVPEGRGRWRTMADWLNQQGVKTIRGGAWTSESVRKLVGRRAAS